MTERPLTYSYPLPWIHHSVKEVHGWCRLRRSATWVLQLQDKKQKILYILQKSFCPNSTIKNIKDYRLKLAMQLIGQYCSRQRAGRRPVAIRPLPFHHFPVRIPSDSEVVKHKRGRCAYCKETSHTRKDSYWFCRECEVWLCHSGYSDDCFLLWHTQRLSGELWLPIYTIFHNM